MSNQRPHNARSLTALAVSSGASLDRVVASFYPSVPFAAKERDSVIPRVLIAAVALTTLLPGCGPRSGVAPDGVLLTLDTCRGDRWGCTGDMAARTPHLDRLARSGSLAFEGRAPAPITLPSHATMMTGLPPSVHGVHDNGVYRLSSESGITLAEVLRDAGYRTAAFVSAFPLASRFGMDRGFHHYDDALQRTSGTEPRHLRERRADRTVARVKRWLRETPSTGADAPLFLWAHFFDPHADYAPPAPWTNASGGDAYRAEIAFVDTEVGELLRTLDEARPGRTRCVVVASDHGEGLGDAGESTHGILLRLSTIRVPMLAVSDKARPALLGGARSLARVPATVLSLLGVEGALSDGAAPVLEAPVTSVQAETFYGWFNFGFHALRSRESGRWRLVSGKVDRLYDLLSDPGETTDLALEYPEVAADLRSEMEDAWREQRSQSARGAEREMEPEESAALRSLGYAAGASRPTGSLERGLASGPSPEGLVEFVDVISRGIALLESGNAEEAVTLLGASSPSGTRVRMRLEYLGRALLELDRYEEAVAALREAVTLGRNPETVYLDLARAEGALGHRAELHAAYARALRMHPGSVAARQGLAQAYLVEGEGGKAADVLLEAARIRPRSAVVHLNLAQVLEMLGRAEEAQVHWRKCLELDPDGPSGEAARRVQMGRGESGNG